MKKLSKILLGLVIVLTAYSANAKAAVDGEFFVGTWNVVIEGTPSGDSKMILEFVKKDDKIVCIMKAETGESQEVERLEITDNEFTIYWTANGYNVYLFMEKDDENKIVGSLMDMFDATGERVVEKE